MAFGKGKNPLLDNPEGTRLVEVFEAKLIGGQYAKLSSCGCVYVQTSFKRGKLLRACPGHAPPKTEDEEG